MPDNANFNEILKSSITLPSPPAIAVRVLESVQKDQDSLRDLARVVASDPALTSKVLQIANSSIYGLSRKVDSLEMALTVLGSNALKNIALSFVMAGEVKNASGGAFNFDEFWQGAVTKGVAAEVAADLLNKKNDDNFMCGLLQDIGYLVMFLTRPDDYIRVMENVKSSGDCVLKSEKQIFGFDHQELGAAMLQKWGLPETIFLPIKHHHDVENCPETEKERASILALADMLASCYRGYQGSKNVPKVRQWLVEKHSLSAETIEKLIDSVAEKTLELLSSFEVDANNMKPLSQLLQEANQELGKLNCSYEHLVVDLEKAKSDAENLASELMKANEKLRSLAVEDGLTGLFNHRYFHETLEKELERSKRHTHCLSLIIFDIDYFKKFNDTYGHLVGDQVLKAIAIRLKRLIRSSDILSRFGGEEFAVILPETNSSGLRVFGERVRRGIENMEMDILNQRLKVTVSVGGTTFEPDMNLMTKESFIGVADSAVYQSKDMGRNRFTFLSLQDHIIAA